MILFLYYHSLCNFMSAYVISHISEVVISTKSSPCLSEKFSIAFSVSNHVPSMCSRKSPERVFQQYIALSKLTSGLKSMPKWSKKSPIPLNSPFSHLSQNFMLLKFNIFFYKIPFSPSDGKITLFKSFKHIWN